MSTTPISDYDPPALYRDIYHRRKAALHNAGKQLDRLLLEIKGVVETCLHAVRSYEPYALVTRLGRIRAFHAEALCEWAKSQECESYKRIQMRWNADSAAYVCTPIQRALDELESARVLLFDHLEDSDPIPQYHHSAKDDEEMVIRKLDAQFAVISELSSNDCDVNKSFALLKDMVEQAEDDTVCVDKKAIKDFRSANERERVQMVRELWSKLGNKQRYEPLDELWFKEHVLRLRMFMSIYYVDKANGFIPRLQAWVENLRGMFEAQQK